MTGKKTKTVLEGVESMAARSDQRGVWGQEKHSRGWQITVAMEAMIRELWL